MKEKVIIKGQRTTAQTAILLSPAAIFSAVAVIVALSLLIKGPEWPYVWYTHPKFFIALGCFLIATLFYFLAKAILKSEITVTDKRVYGTASFGKRVDLPVDSISAVSTEILSGVSVATASGRISFSMMQNNNEIHQEISKLLIARQNKSTEVTNQVNTQSAAKELKEFKDLLDSGIITQEEFDAKKKQLLG